MSDEAYRDGLALPVGSIGRHASGWWGLCFLLLSETTIFAYLFFSYFYYATQPGANWIPGGPPDLFYPGLQSGAVLIGCAGAWLAERGAARGGRLWLLLGLLVTVVFGAGFIALQALDWSSKSFGFADSTYSSEYFVITGFHLAHFAVGWLMSVVLFLWSAIGYFDRARHIPVTVGAFYWYFLTLLWFAVFLVLDATPYF